MEPKAPKLRLDVNGLWETCGECGEKLFPLLALTMTLDSKLPNYCPNCGNEINWGISKKEQVLSALKACQSFDAEGMPHRCDDCPYGKTENCLRELKKDLIDVLEKDVEEEVRKHFGEMKE